MPLWNVRMRCPTKVTTLINSSPPSPIFWPGRVVRCRARCRVQTIPGRVQKARKAATLSTQHREKVKSAYVRSRILMACRRDAKQTSASRLRVSIFCRKTPVELEVTKVSKQSGCCTSWSERSDRRTVPRHERPSDAQYGWKNGRRQMARN